MKEHAKDNYMWSQPLHKSVLSKTNIIITLPQLNKNIKVANMTENFKDGNNAKNAVLSHSIFSNLPILQCHKMISLFSL